MGIATSSKSSLVSREFLLPVEYDTYEFAVACSAEVLVESDITRSGGVNGVVATHFNLIILVQQLVHHSCKNSSHAVLGGTRYLADGR